jgi:hydroxymethylpyrimidine pyrophosphatase-like HAD family hydrolase/energy-coupling factor transporter ATP-binding protein EcfA2
MRYLALAVDFDGTAASDDRLSSAAEQALKRLPGSGRHAILVTGRRLDVLRRVCPDLRLFDLIVAENGGVLFDPRRCEEMLLAPPPPQRFVQRLAELGVEPLDVGRVLISTREQHRNTIYEVIRELSLEVQVIFNRSFVMVLPPGVNKATGLHAALRRLGLSRHEVVGAGDAENDHAFLSFCECGVAVANAVDSLKNAADMVTRGRNGEGVAELVDELIRTDLRALEGKVERHLVTIGKRANGSPVTIPPYGHNILIAGPSGSGKSTLTAGIVEALIDKTYQVCIIDPEGDYSTMQPVIALGNQQRAPSVNEVLSILEDPVINLSVNLLGLPIEDRPFFFSQLIPGLQAMRARTGRPHWIVLDEAHHMMPQTWGHAGSTLPRKLGEVILVTVHPDHVEHSMLAPVDIVFAIGRSPEQTLRSFADAAGHPLDWPSDLEHQPRHVVAWFVAAGTPPFSMQPRRTRAERIRHHRKYAVGDLRWHSFYFRGPDGRHNLKAQNLAVFCQIAAGIDEPTWLFHLRRNDYSRWIRECVRDPWLAERIEPIERRMDLSPQQTRDLVQGLIRARYTLPD